MSANPMHVILVMEMWGKGGTETYVSGLVNMLQAQGIDCSLVLMKDFNLISKDEFTIPILFGYRGLLINMLSKKSKILNLHLYSSLMPVSLLAKLMFSPIVTTLHMPLSAWGFRHRVYWKIASRISTIVVCVSKAVLEQQSFKNIYQDPIPGGVAQQFFENSKTQVRCKSDDCRIIAIGRLSVEKDWITLLKAVASLLSVYKDKIMIDFCGVGPMQSELELYSKQHGIRSIFHGHLAKCDLINIIADSDLSVLPSRFEGLGLSALEAMAVGVPTIVADFAAANDFIESGVTGNLFPRGDAYQLSQLIIWHVDNPELSNNIGTAGRKYVRDNFSDQVTYQPYLKVFEEIIA